MKTNNFDEFNNKFPTESGWYLVKWDPRDSIVLVYVHTGFKPKFLAWGDDEIDDPEGLSEKEAKENGTLWKKITPEEARELLD